MTDHGPQANGNAPPKQKKTFAACHQDTIALAAMLREVREGEKIKYQTLAQAIGYPVDVGIGRGRLASARKIVERDSRALFTCEAGEGLVRLSNSDIPDHGRSYVDRSHRSARRGLRILEASDVGRFTAMEKRRFNTAAAMLGTLSLLSTGRAVKKIETKVGELTRVPSLRETLRIFEGE